ncbi:MAG: arylsulfatase [Hyphomicrobiaceae bacterium]
MIITSSFLASSVALALAMGTATAALSQARPNFLLVMADDMGWTDLGVFGSEIDTPHLDNLAAQGVMFTDFHASVSCSPTRSMLMSGNDNHVAGLGNMSELLTSNQEGKPGYEGHLNNRVVTVAEVLRQSGYHTYMAGKWHLGHGEGLRPHDRGFDQTLTMLVGGASHYADMLGILPRDDPAAYARNGKELKSLRADFYSSRSYADALIDMIRSNKGDGKPFFAYLAFTAPHDPVHAPETWFSKYAGRYDDGYSALRDRRWKAAKKLGIVPASSRLAPPAPIITPWDKLTEDQKALESRGMEVYAGMLEAMDYHFGRVVRFLENMGELDNTVIFFLSDNGANPWYSKDYPDATEPEFANQFDNSLANIGHPRSNYAYGPGFASGSAGPLDRFKMTVGEGGIRVPLLIAGPGISKDVRTDAFAYVWDIMPTMLEIAGAKFPLVFNGRDIEKPRGRSMMPLLTGAMSELYSNDEFIGGEMGDGKWMRKGPYKAVSIPKPYGDGAWRLFNVEEDPGEANNLAAKMPTMLASLRSAWDKYAADVGVVPSK